jgi:hypothetical protein
MMPKVDQPLFGESASGSIKKTLTFSNQWGWAIARSHRSGTYETTPDRDSQLNKFRAALQAWRGLADPERDNWRSVTVRPMSVINLFIYAWFRGMTWQDFITQPTYGTLAPTSAFPNGSIPVGAFPYLAFQLPFQY